MRGKWNGQEAVGKSLTGTGYTFLTMQYDHPLATSGNVVMQHRAILFDKIGWGPHPCHWLKRYGCGMSELHWGGLGGTSLCVDHLDSNRANNSPENLVPCCTGCNIRRGRQSLSDEAVLEIRRRHAAGNATHKALAKEFNTSDRTVSRIVKRQVLANLADPSGGDANETTAQRSL